MLWTAFLLRRSSVTDVGGGETGEPGRMAFSLQYRQLGAHIEQASPFKSHYDRDLSADETPTTRQFLPDPGTHCPTTQRVSPTPPPHHDHCRLF